MRRMDAIVEAMRWWWDEWRDVLMGVASALVGLACIILLPRCDSDVAPMADAGRIIGTAYDRESGQWVSCYYSVVGHERNDAGQYVIHTADSLAVEFDCPVTVTPTDGGTVARCEREEPTP